MNLDSLDLPERVQRIIDGVGAVSVGCSQCRRPSAALLRCSRCKVAKYCSSECQKQHFSLHKKNCKCIHAGRAALEEDWPEDSLELPTVNFLLLRQETAKKSIALADLLVKTGYRESDTIAQASRYYREALNYYLLPMTVLPAYHSMFPWVEDCILLLLLVLGGDHRTLKDWSTNNGSERLARCYLPANELDCEGEWAIYDGDWDNGSIPKFQLVGYATDDVTFQALQLLGMSKRLNDYNNFSKGLEVYKETMESAAATLGLTVSVGDLVDHIAPYLIGDIQYRTEVGEDGEVRRDNAIDQIVERRKLIHDIVNVLNSIYYHGTKHGLRQRPTGRLSYLLGLAGLAGETFDRECAPRMFGGGLANPPNYYWLYEDGGPESPINKAPAELWMIFRDVFDEVPGLKELLVAMMGMMREDNVGGGKFVHSDSDGNDSKADETNARR